MQVDEIAFIASPIRIYTLSKKHGSLADFVNARDLMNATWHYASNVVEIFIDLTS